MTPWNTVPRGRRRERSRAFCPFVRLMQYPKVEKSRRLRVDSLGLLWRRGLATSYSEIDGDLPAGSHHIAGQSHDWQGSTTGPASDDLVPGYHEQCDMRQKNFLSCGYISGQPTRQQRWAGA